MGATHAFEYLHWRVQNNTRMKHLTRNINIPSTIIEPHLYIKFALAVIFQVPFWFSTLASDDITGGTGGTSGGGGGGGGGQFFSALDEMFFSLINTFVFSEICNIIYRLFQNHSICIIISVTGWTSAQQRKGCYNWIVHVQYLYRHCNDVIMSAAMASQFTGVSAVYSSVCSGAAQRKHQSSASLAFVRGIHRWPVNSPHKGPVTRKMFPFDDVILRKLTLSRQLQMLWDGLSEEWWGRAHPT